MAGLARPVAATYAGGTLFVLASAALGLAIPQLIKVIVDDLVRTGSPPDGGGPAAIMVLVLALDGVAVFLRDVLFQRAASSAAARLRRDALSNLLRQELGFFDRERTGDLSGRLLADVELVEGALAGVLAFAI